MFSLIEGKGFGFGSRGGGFKGGSKRFGTFGRPSGYGPAPSYGTNMNRP
jgi:hypothetical protein